MHIDQHEFIETMAGFLGWFHAIVCAMNLLATFKALRSWRTPVTSMYVRAGAWLAVAVLFGVASWRSFAGNPPMMPEGLKHATDAVLGPVTFTLGCFAVLCVLYLGRKFFVIPAVAFTGLNLALLWMGLSMTDPEFAAIVAKPDNVPIVAMVYLLGFFTWLAAAQAVENDRRHEQGRGPAEKEQQEKVLVWPDLVYTELICMILATVVLIVWSLALTAPLEQPANPVVTPNPSKAPWYFLGLQEMLRYSDPWNVGVVVPCLIIFGLMAVPYLDCNPEGGGQYTIDRRRFAYKTFLFGFLQLWVLLILIGTFMRGPNWTFFGLYEFRDPHKVTALSNVALSEYFWAMLLGLQVPQVPAEAGAIGRLAHILWREIAGVVFLAIYFIALPPILGRTILRKFRRQMGFGRFTLMTLLLLMMLTLPLKMILQWTLNLSYIVSIPEYFFNF